MDKSPLIQKARDLSEAEIRAAAAAVGGDTAAMARALEVSERGLKLRMRELNIV
jgi:DNA-binding NtrC family response regulator